MDTIDPSLPPHNLEAEQAALGSLLIDPDAMLDVAEIVTAADFYRPAHRWTFAAMSAMHARQAPLDVLALAEELTRAGKLEAVGGLPALLELTNAVPTSINADHYARIVAEKAQRRRLIAAAGQIARAAYDETIPIDDARAAAEAAVMAVGGDTSDGPQSARRALSDYIEDFLADVANPQTPRVVATGLVDLDRFLGGLEAPHQYILAGRTSMGKSALALGIALHAVMRQNKRAMLFSLEMSREQILNRLIAMMTGIATERLKAARRHELGPAEQARVMEASGRLSDSGLYLDTTEGIRPADVRNRAARIHAAHGLDLIIVDHLHIMRANAPTGKPVQDLGSIALDLADVYKGFNVAGLTLAQLNRGIDARAIKQPVLSDLRESGQIEENAHTVLFINRPAYYDATADETAAQVIIAKNRDGQTGAVNIHWNPGRAMYVNAARPINL